MGILLALVNYQLNFAAYEFSRESAILSPMDKILFSLGNFDVSVGVAIASAVTSVFIALVALLIVQMSQNSARIDAAAKTEKDRLAPQLEDKNLQLDKLEEELVHLRQTNVSLSAQTEGLRVKLTEQAKQNTYVHDQMQGKFKLLAQDVLTSQGEKFSRQNREQVDNLLKPLREKISEFQKQNTEGAEQLKLQMKTLTEDSLRMSEEATNLTRALKGNAQTQGAWGEMILSNILEKSGLIEGKQFLTQQTHRAEGISKVRTDVEVLFPNGDRMIVDSKVSLVAFEALCNCDDVEQKSQFLREHIASIKNHIKTLSDKDYQVHARSGLDFVMMFIPIEGAFSEAFNADASLIDYAMKQNVYITTPTTLMVALRTVRNVWDIETRNQNAEKIAAQAGSLYDKFSGYLESMDKLEKSLITAHNNFDEAKNRLSSGRNNVIGQVKKLEKLGAKTQKPLPLNWEEETLEGSQPDEEPMPDFLSAPDKTSIKN